VEASAAERVIMFIDLCGSQRSMHVATQRPWRERDEQANDLGQLLERLAPRRTALTRRRKRRGSVGGIRPVPWVVRLCQFGVQAPSRGVHTGPLQLVQGSHGSIPLEGKTQGVPCGSQGLHVPLEASQ
jgi:hypothetical protein